jgi:hypothetical protein
MRADSTGSTRGALPRTVPPVATSANAKYHAHHLFVHSRSQAAETSRKATRDEPTRQSPDHGPARS